jgi:hypothetical protein
MGTTLTGDLWISRSDAPIPHWKRRGGADDVWFVIAVISVTGSRQISPW